MYILSFNSGAILQYLGDTTNQDNVSKSNIPTPTSNSSNPITQSELMDDCLITYDSDVDNPTAQYNQGTCVSCVGWIWYSYLIISMWLLIILFQGIC